MHPLCSCKCQSGTQCKVCTPQSALHELPVGTVHYQGKSCTLESIWCFAGVDQSRMRPRSEILRSKHITRIWTNKAKGQVPIVGIHPQVCFVDADPQRRVEYGIPAVFFGSRL